MNLTPGQEKIVKQALTIVRNAMYVPGLEITDVDTCTTYLTLKLGMLEREALHVIFLNKQNQVLDDETMFMGTGTKVPVFPREIARKALTLNATRAIISHNHINDVVQPSDADIDMTEQVISVLSLIGVELLDHIIICKDKSYSFSTEGLLPN